MISSAPILQSSALLRVEGLGLTIEERPILRGVSFTVVRGSCVALLGANGAGKSTLLKILATLVAPSSGRIELFGQPLRREAAQVRRRIGLIGHQSMLYHELTARENLEFFGALYGLPDTPARAAELLKRVRLGERADHPVKGFSRGMVQRVAIARALMHDPDLLLADEPFAGLDVPSARDLEATLRQLRQEGKTIVLANHDIRQSLELADQVLVLRRGQVALDRACAEADAAAVLEVTCS